jgi:hypothetical protein
MGSPVDHIGDASGAPPTPDATWRLPERAARRASVVHGFAKLLAVGKIGVAVVADDEDDALLRVGRGKGAT